MKKRNRNILVIIILFCIILINIFPFYREHKKEDSIQNIIENVKIGDEFIITIISDNPFEESLIIEGKIIDKKDNYIQYINKRRKDTCSINLYYQIKYNKFQKIIRDTIIVVDTTKATFNKIKNEAFINKRKFEVIDEYYE